MRRYLVQHAYTAVRDGHRFGPWEPGTEVELSEQDAAWVNRDSPGALTEPTPPPKSTKAPAANRQHRGGQDRGQP